MEHEISIRLAVPADGEALLALYRPYVEETAITFEYDVPTVEEFTKRIGKTLEMYPYLVAEVENRAVGYAYAGAFQERAAYAYATETSIYVEKTGRRSGVGRKLYDCLEKLLAKQGILNMYACIAYAWQRTPYLTNGSVAFHEKMGFSMVGHFHRCGYKFNQWYDMLWMEKQLGAHEGTPVTVKNIRTLGETVLRECGLTVRK